MEQTHPEPVPKEHLGAAEYEREPVPEKAWLGFKSFIGQYAGEHCAGTELMIGPLFVAAGVSAFDVVVGLIVGNLLAVLSWVFFTAPIATRARLTLYYQLEKICGRNLVVIYNVLNGLAFCFLAGAMVTVSATAVGEWLNLPMPGLNDYYPTSISWVVSVLVVGAAIAVVAAYGYKVVARFANIAAPWMVLVFLAFGFVALRQFIDVSGYPVNSAGDLWALASEVIWRGDEPLPGRIKFTFWHVTFFAWFCNMAMHIGMSDLSVLRYAKKSWYGIASASGMYVGHFMAWLSASMLFAFQLRIAGLITPEAIAAADLAGTLPAPLPGKLAADAAGWAGLLCVIIAGWTTANPTIYRAGLAFQALVPNKSRFAVTLVTGAVVTVAAMFPWLAMKLLDFVAIYGMILMPMGAVIFVDFWLLKKFGLQSNYAEVSRSHFNLAAAITYFGTVLLCLVLNKAAGVQIYFVSLPGWFIAAALYIVSSKLYQRRVAGAGSEVS
jgi:purine-cytosine permease-like protein